MLELGVGADIVRGIGAIFWGILAIALLVALIKPKSIKAKALSSLLVLGIFFGPMVPGAMRAYEYKQRFAKAKALFDERCKTAGEKIYRTVENVDKILLLKIRLDYEDRFASDPMYPGAALIKEGGGDTYIASFLRYEKTDTTNGLRTMQLSDRPTSLPGYRIVEAIEPKDGKRYAYTKIYGPDNPPPSSYVSPPKLNKGLAIGDLPRYAVTYEDLVNPEDRKNWIAGTVLKVFDTATNELLAEQTRYLFDTGLGSTDGQRSPWAWASSYVPGCSKDPRSHHETRFFCRSNFETSQGGITGGLPSCKTSGT